MTTAGPIRRSSSALMYSDRIRKFADASAGCRRRSATELLGQRRHLPVNAELGFGVAPHSLPGRNNDQSAAIGSARRPTCITPIRQPALGGEARSGRSAGNHHPDSMLLVGRHPQDSA